MSNTSSKSYSVTGPRGEPLRVEVIGGPDVPDLDKEAEHVGEAIAALRDAKYHFDRVKGAHNRVTVSFHLPRIEAQLDRERKAIAHEHFKSERRIAAYRAEATGVAIFEALGLPTGTIAVRLRALEAEIDRDQQEAQRKAQRGREAALFRGATLAAQNRKPRTKVSDASLIAEVKSKRHRSISDLARAVGLAVPTTWVRIERLVKSGQLSADAVPRAAGAGGRPRKGN